MSRQHQYRRTAVVTGGASGIGAAIAERFASEGARVVIVDTAADTERCARALGGLGVRADVSSEPDWATVAAMVGEEVDVLVSNAAVQIPAAVTDARLSDWDAQFAVNVRGAFLGLRQFLPALSRRRGNAVLISSVHALVGLPAHPAYAATKAALTALTRQVAVDYAPVRVNCVLPGPILTPAWDGIDDDARARSVAQTPLRRLGKPSEVAAAVSFLASEDASFVTGSSLVVDGGWSIVKDSA